jgi:TPR repeat protein
MIEDAMRRVSSWRGHCGCGAGLKGACYSQAQSNSDVKPSNMKTLRSQIVALSACLLAIMGYSVESHAQADKDVSFQAGIAAYQANDLPRAYKEFLAAATAGHTDSQFNVALMYEQGIGVGKDEKEAVSWYAKAAAQGHPAAQYNLGVLYENGRGTEIDFAKANEWYRKASVQGDALAIGNLGMLYVRGQGVKENKVAGVALLLLSATLDPSPENHAKQNISGARGLTTEMIVAAQALSSEFSSAQNLLVPLDQYLKKSETSTENK